MVFPLGEVLSLAPSIIEATAGIIKTFNSGSNQKTIKEVEELLGKQAAVLQDIAESNRNLALAVRTNRIIAGVSMLVAIGALVFVIVR